MTRHLGRSHDRVATFFVLLLALSGCAISSAPMGGDFAALKSTESMDLGDSNGRLPESTGVNALGSSDDGERLWALWQSRTQAKPFSDYPIGPGDLIVITVPAIKELNDVTVRVSVNGDINLPLIGQINTREATEASLREEVSVRLQKYMYNPQFQLFLKEYKSREVAIFGAVNHPGIFTLTGSSETILQLISSAGGPLDTAANRIILIPATPGRIKRNLETYSEQIPGIPSATSVSGGGRRITLQSGELSPPAPNSYAPRFVGSNERPLVITLDSDSSTGSERYLNMPLRPGDVVVIPSSGEVAVIGWVYNPGHFKITSGLSALAAIAAAGGPLFAADESNIRLLRANQNGKTQSMDFDLRKIRAGKEADPPVQANDVIEVSYSNAKILPYVFYNVINNKLGVAMPMF